ncbi:MAG: L,D-transpeptidase family protein [Brachymonas sp.]|nr:L,D-transpeptidase family protein [Brachymonas sp.]
MFASADSDHALLIQRRSWLRIAAGLALLPACSTPFQAQAQKTSKAARKRRYPLPAGRYYWIPQIAPTGPVVTVVNLHTQMVQVFRNGVAIGFSSASTGKTGYGTQSDLFSILEKRRHHRSSTYNNAPMPWMVRLTWSGVAFHAGALPGYPASHGCIRLPHDFAPKFFDTVARGDTVWITRNALPSQTSPMSTLAPITPDGQPLLTPAAFEQAEYWRPTPAESLDIGSPVLNVLVSLSQQRLYVLQHGSLLAAAALPAQAQAIQLDGGALFEWQTESSTATNHTASSQAGRWIAQDATATQWGDGLLQNLLPEQAPFTQRLKQLLVPGSRLFISHLPAVNDLHWAVDQAEGS